MPLLRGLVTADFGGPFGFDRSRLLLNEKLGALPSRSSAPGDRVGTFEELKPEQQARKSLRRIEE